MSCGSAVLAGHNYIKTQTMDTEASHMIRHLQLESAGRYISISRGKCLRPASSLHHTYSSDRLHVDDLVVAEESPRWISWYSCRPKRKQKDQAKPMNNKLLCWYQSHSWFGSFKTLECARSLRDSTIHPYRSSFPCLVSFCSTFWWQRQQEWQWPKWG